MKITRMNWAGIHVNTSGVSIAIDPILRYDSDFFGEPKQKLYPLCEYPPVDAVLITHVHSDHFDPTSIQETYGLDIPVYVPNEVKAHANRHLRNVHGVQPGDDITIDTIRISVVPAVDGLGDPQVSYAIFADGVGLFHGGDTLWHGHWWNIAKLGKIDIACLPINGAIVENSGMQQSDQPISMNPEQAVSAAKLLGANTLIPIHFQTFHTPSAYSESPEVKTRLVRASNIHSITLCMLEPKEDVEINNESIGLVL